MIDRDAQRQKERALSVEHIRRTGCPDLVIRELKERYPEVSHWTVVKWGEQWRFGGYK